MEAPADRRGRSRPARGAWRSRDEARWRRPCWRGIGVDDPALAGRGRRPGLAVRAGRPRSQRADRPRASGRAGARERSGPACCSAPSTGATPCSTARGSRPAPTTSARLREHQATVRRPAWRNCGGPATRLRPPARWRELSREVDEYLGSVLPIIAARAGRSGPADIRRIMRERVIPRRANVERIVAAGAVAEPRAACSSSSRRKAETVRPVADAVPADRQPGPAAEPGRRRVRHRATSAASNGRCGRKCRPTPRTPPTCTGCRARLVRAQEDERRLIARELHDEVGQALTAVKMQLAVASRSVPPTRRPASTRPGTSSMPRCSRHASSRGCCIRPMLDDMGLGAGARLRTSRRSANGPASPPSSCTPGMDDRPAPEVEICLFRIVQEATTNIARHAAATSCRVYVQRLPPRSC